ncbi:hypothetical protein BDF22DRAFT_622043 [Syncephalis plumigaleata]|nr:hypothetical protein BDF22DRAFT_622043 [Syncephalis plumigaleata]
MNEQLHFENRIINFYHRGEPYYEFTNFYQAPIYIDGYYWKTTEHYFQAQKFIHMPHLYHRILTARSARAAFSIARENNRHKRSDWELCKNGVMYKALYAKFMQHLILTRKLVATGRKLLVEHTYNDHYWGDGGDGSGMNWLGHLLMRLRDTEINTMTICPCINMVCNYCYRNH